MKKRYRRIRISNPGLALAMVAGLVVAGCEVIDTQDTVITITPASVAVAPDTTRVFTASSAGSNIVLHLPLKWTVSDQSLGTIISSAGLTAVYEAGTASGNNIITVRDQGDAVGIAVVSQE